MPAGMQAVLSHALTEDEESLVLSHGLLLGAEVGDETVPRVCVPGIDRSRVTAPGIDRSRITAPGGVEEC